MTERLQGHYVAAGEGDLFTFNGTDRHMKATGRDTDGSLTVFESTYPAGVPHPLHIHHDAVESFYILEGTCRFHVGGELITAAQAAFVSIPRGVTHGFVPLEGGARALVMFTPAAMEGFWEEIAAASEAGSMDQMKLAALQRLHHIELIGPLPKEPFE